MSQRSARIAAEGGDAPGFLVDALEAGDHCYLLPLLEALDDLLAVDVEDAGGAVGVGGQDRQLPALPGAGVDPHALQGDRQEPGRDLLARGDHGVVFARVVQGRGLAAPADQLVGLAGHRRHHHGNLMAGIDLALDVAGHIADAVDIGDRGSAEFHDKTGHGGIGGSADGCAAAHKACAQPRKGAYS
jgi:2-polyprenyl-6-hydroxyphenyl methylase/3-demethylubiquinone-9 3-methyltransferase